MTKPIVDYFIENGEMITRDDERFAELEAKYVKEIEFNVEGSDKDEHQTSKESSK